MMFSATMNKEVRNTCRKFVRNQVEIFIDDPVNPHELLDGSERKQTVRDFRISPA